MSTDPRVPLAAVTEDPRPRPTARRSARPRWTVAPVDDRALRHSVARHVLEAVRTGRLQPGARVHEVSLARALDVSLSPVREALFRLADQGLLEHRPRRGFYVATIGPEEVREIYPFRALLEGFAARLIAERCAAGGGTLPPDDRAAFRRLEDLIAAGDAAGADVMEVRAINARFHDELIRLARHRLLERSWALLAPSTWLLTPGLRPAPLTPVTLRDWIERHHRLLRVIQSGDARAAELEAVAHVREAGASNLMRRVEHGTLAED